MAFEAADLKAPARAGTVFIMLAKLSDLIEPYTGGQFEFLPRLLTLPNRPQECFRHLPLNFFTRLKWGQRSLTATCPASVTTFYDWKFVQLNCVPLNCVPLNCVPLM